MSTLNAPHLRAPFQTLSPARAAMRGKLAGHRKQLYLKLEKMRALFSPALARRILFSGKPEWAEEIKSGFRHLSIQVEFGPISEDSYRQYDLVVPLSLAAIEDARAHAPQQRMAFPLPSAQAVRLCHDKYAFNQALIEAGFGSYIPRVAQGLALTPPYILKRRTGEWGLECYLIRDRDEEEAHLDQIVNPSFFCQEFIPGTTEFATHVLFVGGKIIKALNIRYTFASDRPIKGQNAEILQSIHSCSHLDLFARILRTLQFEGLCCVNYKIAKGRLFLLEINPRFGGSLAPYFFSFVRHLR